MCVPFLREKASSPELRPVRVRVARTRRNRRREKRRESHAHLQSRCLCRPLGVQRLGALPSCREKLSARPEAASETRRRLSRKASERLALGESHRTDSKPRLPLALTRDGREVRRLGTPPTRLPRRARRSAAAEQRMQAVQASSACKHSGSPAAAWTRDEAVSRLSLQSARRVLCCLRLERRCPTRRH